MQYPITVHINSIVFVAAHGYHSREGRAGGGGGGN